MTPTAEPGLLAEPFLFFRGPRGHMTWWSFARCRDESGSLAARDATEPATDPPRHLLAILATATAAELAAARQLLAHLGGASGREIWISTRPLDGGAERQLALAALLAGWAIVREPGERLHPDLFAWARPTLLSGTGAELGELLRGFAAAAPRFGAARWLRRRLHRLQVVLIEEAGEGAGERAGLAAQLRELGGVARVLPFPDCGW